jgi:hypothetical protein
VQAGSIVVVVTALCRRAVLFASTERSDYSVTTA